MKIKMAVMASGTGTNFEVLVNEAKNLSNAEISLLICDQKNALCIEKAAKFNIPCYVIERGKSKKDFEDEILNVLLSNKIEWVFLAGFMRLLSPGFLKNFYDRDLRINRILNIHPSLLPSFKGLNAYEKAYEYKVKVSGVTVHFVDEGMDTGKILFQKSFKREAYDSFEDFLAKGKKCEWELYKKAILLVTEKEKLISELLL